MLVFQIAQTETYLSYVVTVDIGVLASEGDGGSVMRDIGGVINA
jgi:hypothetical protein